MLAHSCLDTAIGTLQLVASERGLVEVQLVAARTSPTRYCGVSPATEILSEARRQMSQYFVGERRRFSVPLAPEGSAFERAVWQAMRDVPFAKTVTYGQLAEAVGKPGGAQAVGQAVGANPIAIIQPCQRIVAAAGLGGYAWGLARKRWLLEHEARVAVKLSERSRKITLPVNA